METCHRAVFGRWSFHVGMTKEEEWKRGKRRAEFGQLFRTVNNWFAICKAHHESIVWFHELNVPSFLRHLVVLMEPKQTKWNENSLNNRFDRFPQTSITCIIHVTATSVTNPDSLNMIEVNELFPLLHPTKTDSNKHS